LRWINDGGPPAWPNPAAPEATRRAPKPRQGEKTLMATDQNRQILGNAKFRELVRTRSGFAWTLAAIMLAIYLGFILLVAFAPGLMAVKIAGGVTSLGIVLGLVVIVSAFLLVGLYVQRANGRFDDLTRALRKDLA